MLLYTHIARVEDSLPLVASVESDDHTAQLKEQKSQINTILGMASSHSEPRGSVVSGAYTIHYLIFDGIMYLCISETKFPKTLVFAYLDELSKEFGKSHGAQALRKDTRPYQFSEFDTFIQKSKRVYQDQRATQNLDKINADLQDVSKIMSKNIEDLLYRGEKLDRMSDISTSLKAESGKYRRAAQRVNFEALMRKYAPLGVVGVIFLFIIWWKFF